MLDIGKLSQELGKTLDKHKESIITELIESKRLSPLAIDDVVYFVTKSIEHPYRIIKATVAEIVQDSTKTFCYKAIAAHVFSADETYETFVYFKDSDIGKEVFKTKEEILEASITEIEDPLNTNTVKAVWINPSQNPEVDNKWFFSDCSNCGYMTDSETTVCPNCNAEMVNGDPERD